MTQTIWTIYTASNDSRCFHDEVLITPSHTAPHAHTVNASIDNSLIPSSPAPALLHDRLRARQPPVNLRARQPPEVEDVMGTSSKVSPTPLLLPPPSPPAPCRSRPRLHAAAAAAACTSPSQQQPPPLPRSRAWRDRARRPAVALRETAPPTSTPLTPPTDSAPGGLP